MGSQEMAAGPQGTGPGMAPQGSQGAQPGGQGTMGGTIEPPAGVNEREACDKLTRDATLHIETIEGGVAIVARPRRGVDLSTLRSLARDIERGVERGTPAPAMTQCDLFPLARSGIMAVTEAPDAIRILVTTSDASRVSQVRRQATEFVRSKGGAHKGTAPKGGKQGGGTP